jgi:hypothetical protein
MDHFSSYLTPLVIKLIEVTKRECKIKLMVKSEVQFFEWSKGKYKFFMAKREFPHV